MRFIWRDHSTSVLMEDLSHKLLSLQIVLKLNSQVYSVSCANKVVGVSSLDEKGGILL